MHISHMHERVTVQYLRAGLSGGTVTGFVKHFQVSLLKRLCSYRILTR